MACLGGYTPAVSGAIQPPCERRCAMAVDLSDGAAGFPPDCESLWRGAREARSCSRSRIFKSEDLANMTMTMEPPAKVALPKPDGDFYQMISTLSDAEQ